MSPKWLVVLCLLGCGDNIKPEEPLTWGDAQMVWAEGWCSYAVRCNPEAYADLYPTDQACIDEVYGLNCEKIDCTELYPEDRHGWLEQCREDMESVVCTARSAPDSCFQAFARNLGKN
jgi:hypothetical protein